MKKFTKGGSGVGVEEGKSEGREDKMTKKVSRGWGEDFEGDTRCWHSRSRVIVSPALGLTAIQALLWGSEVAQSLEALHELSWGVRREPVMVVGSPITKMSGCIT